MAHTLEVTLKIKIRKPNRDEMDEWSLSSEDVREMDLESIEAADIVECMNGYFEFAGDEFAAEIMSGSDFFFAISEFKAYKK